MNGSGSDRKIRLKLKINEIRCHHWPVDPTELMLHVEGDLQPRHLDLAIKVEVRHFTIDRALRCAARSLILNCLATNTTHSST